MTCIVGMMDETGVTIGGDSAGVAGGHIVTRDDTKVFTIGEFVIGYTSSFRMAQILRYQLDVADQKQKQTDFEYMCTTFIDEVRKVLKDGGYTTIISNNEEGGSFLVAYKGTLYSIESDFQVGIPSDNFTACGSGAYHAIASMKQSVMLNKNKIKGLNVKKVLTDSLKVSEYFCTGVRGPFNFMKQKK